MQKIVLGLINCLIGINNKSISFIVYMNEIILKIYITALHYAKTFFQNLSGQSFPNYSFICENELTDLDDFEMVEFNELQRL